MLNLNEEDILELCSALNPFGIYVAADVVEKLPTNIIIKISEKKLPIFSLKLYEAFKEDNINFKKDYPKIYDAFIESNMHTALGEWLKEK